MNRDDTTSRDDAARARMAADVDASDKILYGLTFRQLAILAVAVVICYAGWRALHDLVAEPVLLGVGGIIGALAAGLVVGRRDGLPLDAWLRHAIWHSRGPKVLSIVDGATPTARLGRRIRGQGCGQDAAAGTAASGLPTDSASSHRTPDFAYNAPTRRQLPAAPARESADA